MSKNNQKDNPYQKKEPVAAPVAEVSVATETPPEVEQPKLRAEVRTSRVRIVNIEMPIAEEFNGHLSRRIDMTLSPKHARVFARLRTGLVADGATVRRTTTSQRQRHVANSSDVVAWLIERVAEGVEEESPPGG